MAAPKGTLGVALNAPGFVAGDDELAKVVDVDERRPREASAIGRAVVVLPTAGPPVTTRGRRARTPDGSVG